MGAKSNVQPAKSWGPTIILPLRSFYFAKVYHVGQGQGSVECHIASLRRETSYPNKSFGGLWDGGTVGGRTDLRGPGASRFRRKWLLDRRE